MSDRTMAREAYTRSKFFFCSNGGNDSWTQTEIYISVLHPKPKPQVVAKKMVNKCCGLDYTLNYGLPGFADIEDDKTIRQLAGISREFFSVLLFFIVPRTNGQASFFIKL